MKSIKLFTILLFSTITTVGLILTSCGSVAKATITPDANPTVKVDNSIISEGRLEPVHYAEISLNTGGLVSDVLSKEGDQVTAGQVIARIKNDQAQTLAAAQASSLKALTDAYQAARDAQYQLDSFNIPGYFSGMTPLQAAKSTLDELNSARAAFEPYKNFSDLKLQHGNELVDTGVYKSTAKMYKKRLDAAWERYRKAVQWLNLESSVATTKAKLAQEQKNYDSLQDPSLSEDTAGIRAALANAEVSAPFSGTLTNLGLKVGEFAAPGTPVLTIADLTSWVIKTTDLTEIDVVDLREGQPVEVTLDAIPGISFKGYVLSIADNYTEKQGDIVYKVTVLLTDNNPALRWGMTAKMKFIK